MNSDILCMKNVNNFQTTKVLLRVLLSICFIFCHCQPGVAYKSVAYICKKACNKESLTRMFKFKIKKPKTDFLFCL